MILWRKLITELSRRTFGGPSLPVLLPFVSCDRSVAWFHRRHSRRCGYLTDDLDYCNSLLVGLLPAHHLRRLHPNAAAASTSCVASTIRHHAPTRFSVYIGCESQSSSSSGLLFSLIKFFTFQLHVIWRIADLPIRRGRALHS